MSSRPCRAERLSAPPAARMAVEARARASQGASSGAIYRMIARALALRHQGGGVLLDIGCGQGNLWPFVRERFARYMGVDIVRHASFPAEGMFTHADLDEGFVPLPDASGDVVVSVETIEHLENPRALVRELARLAKPGGLVAVTTPNQLSLLSKACLLVKNQFAAFREAPGLYPAHLTALLEVDLLRIAAECGLKDAAIHYSYEGRMPFSRLHYPRPIARLFPRATSDNLLMIGVIPGAPAAVAPGIARPGTIDDG